ncbi:hypothetical protein PPROV_000658800 [Pycnococcus provasolii]|uniref:Chromatin assembly factor 1 subunit A dimerization domain-containing protein n=1 Tax=Pycnococcus provasolii TaxID=41880 RepID=A0A830HKD9_9CHLO|nr:hypothetical protein PPROV_000658800 [Pycnococcus provasolii]
MSSHTQARASGGASGGASGAGGATGASGGGKQVSLLTLMSSSVKSSSLSGKKKNSLGVGGDGVSLKQSAPLSSKDSKGSEPMLITLDGEEPEEEPAPPSATTPAPMFEQKSKGSDEARVAPLTDDVEMRKERKRPAESQEPVNDIGMRDDVDHTTPCAKAPRLSAEQLEAIPMTTTPAPEPAPAQKTAQPTSSTPPAQPQASAAALAKVRTEKERTALLELLSTDVEDVTNKFADACIEREAQLADTPPKLSLPLKDGEVGALIEGMRQPLSRLVTMLLGASMRGSGATPENSPSDQTIRNVILRLAKRENKGAMDGPELDQVDRLENNEPRFMWRWELHTLTTLPPKVRPPAKEARETWTRANKRLGALENLRRAVIAAAPPAGVERGDDTLLAESRQAEIRTAQTKLMKAEAARPAGRSRKQQAAIDESAAAAAAEPTTPAAKNADGNGEAAPPPSKVKPTSAEKAKRDAEKEATRAAKAAEKEAEKKAKAAEKEAERAANAAKKEAEKATKAAEKAAEKAAREAAKEEEERKKKEAEAKAKEKAKASAMSFFNKLGVTRESVDAPKAASAAPASVDDRLFFSEPPQEGHPLHAAVQQALTRESKTAAIDAWLAGAASEMQLHNPIVAMKSSAQRATRYWADRRGVPNQPRRRSLGGCDNGSSPAKAVQMDVDDVMVLDAPPRRQVRARRYRSKLLQFHKDEQVRPAYFGSHRPSKVVKGRRPKARDPDVDYDYESWDDWEEPDEDAESLKSEDDKDDKDDEEGDEADGQFVVPDGYLSAEEARSEDGGGDAEAAAATAESGAVAGMDEAKLSLILCGRCVSAEVPPSAAAHALRRRVDASVRAAARKQSSVLLIAPGCGLKAPVGANAPQRGAGKLLMAFPGIPACEAFRPSADEDPLVRRQAELEARAAKAEAKAARIAARKAAKAAAAAEAATAAVAAADDVAGQSPPPPPPPPPSTAEEEGDGSPSAKAAKEAARAAKAAEKQERDAAKAAEKAAKDEARAAKAKEKQERDAAKAAEKAAKETVKAAKEEEERKKKEAEAAKVERQKANAMKAFFKLGVKRESLDNNNNDDNNDNNGDNSSGAGVEAGAAGAADDPIALDE